MNLPLRKLAIAIVVGSALTGWQTAALARSASATLFDQSIAGGLPQAFSLPRLAEDERGEGVDQVVVKERLVTDVVYPDDSHATTYIGTANGVEATFTRIGDELDISVFDDRPPAATASGQLHPAPPAATNDAFLPPPAVDTPPTTSVDGSPAPRELQFWIFLHDRSGESSYAKFHNWYIAWWIRDMERTVKPGIPVKVLIKDRVPGLTDFDYSQDASSNDALFRFRSIADRYLESRGATPSRLTKTMLFVDRIPTKWGDYIYGVALPGSTVAIASGAGPRHIVAHEFGHTLDAQHSLAEDRFPCVTNMKDYIIGRYSCRIYSGANDVKIREHVKDALEAMDNQD